MSKNSKLLISIYSILLLIGGVIGYLKSGSAASFMMAVGFGFALILLTYIKPATDKKITAIAIILLFLDAFFTYRFLKTFKIIPAGAFSVITFVVLVFFLKMNKKSRV